VQPAMGGQPERGSGGTFSLLQEEEDDSNRSFCEINDQRNLEIALFTAKLGRYRTVRRGPEFGLRSNLWVGFDDTSTRSEVLAVVRSGSSFLKFLFKLKNSMTIKKMGK
jgi:hypothetical protein